MEALRSFFEMGGYAAFVWPCFALAAVLLGYLFAASRRELKSRERRMQALRAASPRRRRRGAGQEATP